MRTFVGSVSLLGKAGCRQTFRFVVHDAATPEEVEAYAQAALMEELLWRYEEDVTPPPKKADA